MVLGEHTNFKFTSLISKVDFGKNDFDENNRIHVMFVKAYARHNQN